MKSPKLFTVIWTGKCDDCSAEHQMTCRTAVETYAKSFTAHCLNCSSDEVFLTATEVIR